MSSPRASALLSLEIPVFSNEPKMGVTVSERNACFRFVDRLGVGRLINTTGFCGSY